MQNKKHTFSLELLWKVNVAIVFFFLWWSSLIIICEGIRVELIVRGEALGFVKKRTTAKIMCQGTVVIDQERKLEREPCENGHHVNFCPSGKTLVEACSDTDVAKLFDKIRFS